MAGGGAPTPSKSGKKSVDFVVNLVPTIDLLSVLISFLLITAVWTQLAKIKTDSAVQRNQQKQEEEKEKEKKINILLAADEVRLNLTGTELKVFKRATYADENKLYDEVKKTVEELKKQAGDTEPPVVLAAEDAIQYRYLIRAMDICLDLNLSKISVGDPEAVAKELG